MDKALQKKLKSYSLTAGTLTMAAAANAQINYTDISPDQTVANNTPFTLDMNGDAVNDFDFNGLLYQDSTGTYGYAIINLPTANGILGQLFSNAYPLPSALNAGDSIRPSAADWQAGSVNGGLQYMAVVVASGPSYGNWPGQNDKYLGVRFIAGSQTHYGWIRCSVSADGSIITIKDYAYNATPGVGLTAGQSNTVGVAENTSAISQIHVYDRTLFVSLAAQTPVGGTVQISDITGKVVRKEAVTEPSMRFGLGDLSTGVYLVQYIQNDGTTITRKIYL
jgi:hypothetical protein